jgi:large subunit ribosomal protein L22
MKNYKVDKKSIKEPEPKKEKKEKQVSKILVRGELKSLPVSPRKLRLVVNMVKRHKPTEALRILPLVNKKGARFVLKALKSVVSNAKNDFGLDLKNLEFEEVVVNEGPRLKRRDRFHGARFSGGLIQKRRAHLKIVVKGEKS